MHSFLRLFTVGLAASGSFPDTPVVMRINTFSLQIDFVRIYFIMLTRNKIRADIESFSPVKMAFSFFRMLRNTFLLFKNNSVYGKLF